MTPLEFCYWLQGFIELTDQEELSDEQMKSIKDHLALVFTKTTPDRKISERKCEDKWAPPKDFPISWVRLCSLGSSKGTKEPMYC